MYKKESAIERVNYIADNKLLSVKLKGGERYLFRNVPEREYHNLLKSYSKRIYFQHNIAYKYKDRVF